MKLLSPSNAGAFVSTVKLVVWKDTRNMEKTQTPPLFASEFLKQDTLLSIEGAAPGKPAYLLVFGRPHPLVLQ